MGSGMMLGTLLQGHSPAHRREARQALGTAKHLHCWVLHPQLTFQAFPPSFEGEKEERGSCSGRARAVPSAGVTGGQLSVPRLRDPPMPRMRRVPCCAAFPQHPQELVEVEIFLPSISSLTNWHFPAPQPEQGAEPLPPALAPSETMSKR